MNTDNTNMENNVGFAQPVDTMQPVNNEPINNMGEETFSPFQDLNNDQLNVPTETTTPAPQPEFQTEPSFYNPGVTVDAPSVEAPQEVLSEPVVSTPVTNVEDLNSTVNVDPTYNNPGEVSQPLDAPQSAPAVENFEPSQAAPVLEPAPSIDANQAVPAENLNVGINDVVTQNTTQVPVTSAEPTMPIPDQMPVTDYQAGVSTPVDYATPMSDFDQIGTTPELDPNAKGKKKTNKFVLALLLLIIIGGIGYGCYYAINVLGLLESSSVEVKNVISEKGEVLSTNLDDYATFKNTSSSNCVLNTEKVVIDTVGTYDFTVTCGKKSYTGKLTIKDTKAPEIEVKTNIIIAGTTLTPEMLVSSASEEAKYAYQSDAEVAAYQTAGLKKVKLNVSDTNSNTRTYVIPVVVTSNEYSMGIVSKKDITGTNTDATIIEKNVILYNNSGGNVNDTSYTAYIIKFNNSAVYKSTIKAYDDSGVMMYDSLTGTPLFYSDSNTLVLVKDINTDLIKEGYNETFANVNGQNGYQAFLVNQIGVNKQLLEFNGI